MFHLVGSSFDIRAVVELEMGMAQDPPDPLRCEESTQILSTHGAHLVGGGFTLKSLFDVLVDKLLIGLSVGIAGQCGQSPGSAGGS